MPNNRPESAAEQVDNLIASIKQLGISLTESVTPALKRVTELLDMIDRSPMMSAWRRERAERALGYRVPDWVWEVRERQRKTFGSGNGKA